MIHPLAHLDETVTIGAGTKVWQFASVIRGAIIGADCVIGANVVIDGARLGDECCIQPFVSIPPGCRLGNRVFVGAGAGFINDRWPFVDKSGVDFDALRQGVTIEIEDDVVIGVNATLLNGIRIGKGAVVAAGARLERDLPPGAVYMPNGYTAPQVPSDWPQRRMRLNKVPPLVQE